MNSPDGFGESPYRKQSVISTLHFLRNEGLWKKNCTSVNGFLRAGVKINGCFEEEHCGKQSRWLREAIVRMISQIMQGDEKLTPGFASACERRKKPLKI